MGTHAKSPSRVLSANVTLASYLASHPDLVGKSIIEKFKDEGTADGNLPFLFKVLSIEKALSIQTHPDKKTAEVLHKSQPEIYKGMYIPRIHRLAEMLVNLEHNQTQITNQKWLWQLHHSKPSAGSVRSLRSPLTSTVHPNYERSSHLRS